MMIMQNRLFYLIIGVFVLTNCVTKQIISKDSKKNTQKIKVITPESKMVKKREMETQKAIQVIQKSRGVFIYKYKGNNVLRPFEPYSDFISKREITNAGIISQIKQIIDENKDFNPEYKKRCLPKWEIGLEFRKANQDKKMLLFSFDCSTMMIYEQKVYRDFQPQKTKLYGLLNYEVNSSTSRIFQKQQ